MSEKELIVALLKHPAGYSADLFSMLEIRSATSDGLMQGDIVYCVGNSCDDIVPKAERWEEVFDTPEEAAEFFIEKRHELELGLDIEAELMSELDLD